MTIYQPRSPGETRATWETTGKGLIELAQWIADMADIIQLDPHADDLPFAPSEDACRWCRARSICPAYAGQLLDVAPPAVREAVTPKKNAPAVVHLAKPDALPVEQIAQIVAVRTKLKKWLDEVADYATEMHPTRPIPGYKLVATQGHRKWSDEAEVERIARKYLATNEIFTVKLASPAQLEEKLKGKAITPRMLEKLEALTVRPEASPALVPESDKRPSINPMEDLKLLS